MVLRAHFTLPPDRTDGDEIVILGGMTWADYERLLAERGDRSAPRIAFLEGTVEIMSPSRDHESIGYRISHLVAAWCLHSGVEFDGVGSWTLKDEAVARGVEPDECYIIGTQNSDRPHLAIEVEWTHGGLDRLEIYRQLNVPEVWRWRRGRIHIHVLRGEAYHEASRSEVLPGLDLGQLVSFLDRPRASQSIREYTEARRQG